MTIFTSINDEIIAVKPLVTYAKSVWTIIASPDLYARQVRRLLNLFVFLRPILLRVGSGLVGSVIKIVLPGVRHCCYSLVLDSELSLFPESMQLTIGTFTSVCVKKCRIGSRQILGYYVKFFRSVV